MASSIFIPGLTTAGPLSPLFDSFGKIRVTNPRSLFDSKQVFNNGTPIQIVEDTTGAAATVTYDQTNARSILTCGTTAAGRATRQSRRYFNYQSGKSMLVLATFNFRGAEPNCEKRVGFFDDDDGIYCALPADNVPLLVKRSSSSSPTESVAQPNWNLDTLDGNGPSGITIDFTKDQILVIDYQWLGVGGIRVGFDIGNQIVYAHYFSAANVLTTVYMQQSNHPVRWEIVGTAVDPATPVMDAICGSVISEGGQEPLGTARAAFQATPVAIGALGTAPLISIRLKSTTPRFPAFPTLMSVAAATQTARGIAELVWNPVLTNPTWTIQPADSAVEADIGATAATGGHVIASFAIGSGAGQGGFQIETEPVVALASDYAGTTQDILCIRFTSIAADSWIAAMNWHERL